MYRAKKIVLNNLKTDHTTAFAKIKKYGNAIIAMNPECFNNWIKDERDKPILTLLKHLMRKIMVRFSDKCDELEKLKDSITPYAREQLSSNEKKGRKLQVYHGMGDWCKTVNKRGVKLVVNIGEVTCDCGMWQISGLPCKHVVTVFMYKRVFPDDHVYWYYTKETLKLTYNGVIKPILEESKWPEYQYQHIDPPTKCAKVGRPKMNRKSAADETRAPSKIFSNRCQTCQTIGHTSHTCPDKGKQVGSSLKKKKKHLKGVLLEQLLVLEPKKVAQALHMITSWLHQPLHLNNIWLHQDMCLMVAHR
ncbi:hypothetical protein Ddye_029776 [Dipteronia dyeriana]|uniref:SWIM-type domain-containing protein n=1 Tax=Dipteronia dyeriana TaxID=168575 RepID=A0AAD9TG53_9ROSI|nr:hypothetical protein Ddye_029776 [Dipteronia dyeriana]